MITEELAAWIREEQAALWTDLETAIRSAVNGQWSMHAAYVARRIVSAARLVGPTPYGDISWSLTAGGVYEALLTGAGLHPVVPDDEAEWRRMEQLMANHGGTRETARPRYAATVAAIDDARERAYINGGD